MRIKLPRVDKIKTINKKSHVSQYFGIQRTLENCKLVSVDPFIVESEGEQFCFTNNEKNVNSSNNYTLLTSRKPSKKDFDNESLQIKKWINHPNFQNLTPEDVLASWKNKFTFLKENEEENTKGLRPPQIGALYSVLAHINNPTERAIVVMPTGTGKTEVMLCSLVANQCQKLLVTVPSDSLRSQLGEKFRQLGLLKELKIIDHTCYNPIVGIMTTKLSSLDELKEFISNSNVVITTMSLLAGYNEEYKAILSSSFTHLFVDEAHHSEAETWKNLISSFKKEKVFLFTATPFRSDEKKLQGKVIFNFPLREAQKQKYYKTINYLPIRDYDQNKADEKIAEKAIAQLRLDISNGFNHIIMARCANKLRAESILKYYSKHEDLLSVIVYTGVTGLSEKIRKIKNREYHIIICVDMLGEGFDLPELKIAAIHDERQSIPITLQFVGRFTRTSYERLGEASFIANLAYPPIQNELDRLYAMDSDWNLLLPTFSETATEKEINFQKFLEGFSQLEKSIIPFQNIRPAMSTVVYKNGKNTIQTDKWKAAIPGIESYDHQYSSYNTQDNTFVIILGKISKVDWGNFDMIQNLEWDIIVVIWDFRPTINRVFVNTSLSDFKEGKLVSLLFGEETQKVSGMDVFRIFNEVKRLSVHSFGGRKGIGKDISFQSYFGKGVQDGLKLLEQGTLIKNNIFGVGYKGGERITLGCSVSGKIWSYVRGNLNELSEWCKQIGELITNTNIDTNTVLKHTLSPTIIFTRPEVFPISVEWHHIMLTHPEKAYQIEIQGIPYDLSQIEVNVVETDLGETLKFSLDTDDLSIIFELELGRTLVDNEMVSYFQINKLTDIPTVISYGKTHHEQLNDFFQRFTPIFWFADGSNLYQNRYVRLKEKVDQIPSENLIPMSWDGVSLKKESQGIFPYIKDSIQYHFITTIIDDFALIYDDDGTGEIADIIGINDFGKHIDIHLYHLKYARGGKAGNNIENFYQVCGQAQKSLNWKYRKGKDLFDHLFKRIKKTKNGKSCSRLIKGTEDELEKMLVSAKWEKELKFHIYIAQPSLRKSEASEDILLILGTVFHYLHTVGNVELKVYTS